MEIINPNMTAGDNARICSTDALAPSHQYEGGGNNTICFQEPTLGCQKLSGGR